MTRLLTTPVESPEAVPLAALGAGAEQKLVGQMTRRKKFCELCRENATHGGALHVVSLDGVPLPVPPPPLTEKERRVVDSGGAANDMRLSRKFLLCAAGGAAESLSAAARSLVPIAQYAKRCTITTKCVVAAKASQCFAQAEGDRQLPAFTAGVAEVVVEASAADRASSSKADPLAAFDADAYAAAVSTGAEFDVPEADIKLACVRLLPADCAWKQQQAHDAPGA